MSYAVPSAEPGKNDYSGITNGADWYQVPGGMEDYNYLYGDCFEITIELTCCKYPEASKLKDEWENNKNALWEYTMAAYQESARNHYLRSWITNEPRAFERLSGCPWFRDGS